MGRGRTSEGLCSPGFSKGVVRRGWGVATEERLGWTNEETGPLPVKDLLRTSRGGVWGVDFPIGVGGWRVETARKGSGRQVERRRKNTPKETDPGPEEEGTLVSGGQGVPKSTKTSLWVETGVEGGHNHWM